MVLSLSRQLKMSAHYEPRGSPRKSPIATKKKKSSRTISSSTLLARGDSLSIGSNNNEIDIAVKKAYTKVKRDREAKRSQLVSDALIECRDKVVHNNILSSAGNKKSSSEEGTAVVVVLMKRLVQHRLIATQLARREKLILPKAQ